MAVDVRTLTVANLIIQLLLVMIISGAVYLAKNRETGRHCTVMNIAAPVEIAAIAAVMFPSLAGYVLHEEPRLVFYLVMGIHHTFGISAIMLWIYINLAFRGIMTMPSNLRTVMKLALASWMSSLVLGLFLLIQVLS